MEDFDANGKVLCKECGKAFSFLTIQHLKLHGLAYQTYFDKYPDAPVASKKGGKNELELKVKNETKNKTKMLTQSLQTNNEELDPTGVTSPSKMELLQQLIKDFPSIKNNYIISIFYGGKLYREYLTDVADPLRKIIFNFPKAFWHNYTLIDNSRHINYLTELGWTIYEINDDIPTIESINSSRKK